MKNLFLLLIILPFGNAYSQVQFSFETADKLPETINSGYEETQPVFDPHTQSLFFTRSLHPANKGGLTSGQDIWTSQKTNTGWDAASNEISVLNNQLNNAALSLSAKGDTLYLLSTYENKLSLQKGFSYSVNQNGIWSKPERIDISGLNIQGNFYSGFVDQSGNVLIISMESRNSLGKEDLYVSLRGEKGWSKPVWLGDSINTEGFEISPYLFNDQITLLFASSGHQGFGDCDIFYSYRKDSTWTNWSKPKNLGPEINSAAFDAYPYAHSERLYFASNRGDSLSNIYSAVNPDYFKPADTLRISFITNHSALSEVSVNVFDDQGMNLGKYTSGKGTIVSVPNLKEGFEYTFKPTHEDVKIELFTPFILNGNNAPIGIAPVVDGQMQIMAASKESNDKASELEEPEFIRGMGGVFELDKVPVRNVILALTDADGFPTQYAVTDENGAFEFAETPDSLELFVEVISDLEYLKKNGAITFTTKDGTRLFKPNKGIDGRFGYEKLQAQEMAQMQLLTEYGDSELRQSSGIFKFQNLPKEGVELYLYDENDNIIETVTTDENGEFRFTKLKAEKGFQIKLSDEMDAEMGDDVSVLFMDSKGNELNILNTKAAGGFEYKPLRGDLSKKMRLLQEEDASSLTRNYVFSVGLFEFQNLPKEGVLLRLLDADDNVIETVATDINGQFVFSMIRPDQQYKVQVGQENNLAIEETEMYFVSKDGNVITAYNEDGTPNYTFTKLNADYFFSIQQLNEGETELQITESFKDISGQFKYQNLPKEGVKLYLLDENNKVIETVYTDENGNFIFSKLAKEANYFVKLAEEDASLLDDASFVMMNENNEELEQDVATDGGFSFRTLPRNSSLLAGMEEEDDSQLNALRQLTSGLFDYHNLPPDGTIIQLLDENDNVIETVTTNKNGQFYFSKMEPGKKYRVKVPDIDHDGINESQLYFISKNGSVVTAYSEDGSKVFAFDQLSGEYFDELSSEKESDSSFDLERTFADILGRATINGEPAAGQWLIVSNADEAEIQKTQVQQDGSFEISRIPRGSDFTIRAESGGQYDVTDLNIELGTSDKKAVRVNKLAGGRYSFQSPAPITTPKSSKSVVAMSGMNGDMNMLSSLSGSGKNDFMLNVTKFHFNSVRLSDRDRAKLNGTIRQVLKTNQPILVVGYSCDLGDSNERKEVASARAAEVKEYMIRMGVDEDRIETAIISDALDQVENPTTDQRVENRKVEVYHLAP